MKPQLVDLSRLRRWHKMAELIDTNKDVKVYFNLRNGLFSVQQDGIVCCHTDKINLTQVKFKVSQAGRERVVREQRKNVHAYVVGKVAMSLGTWLHRNDIVYNPYLYETFVNAMGKPVTEMDAASLDASRKPKIIAYHD